MIKNRFNSIVNKERRKNKKLKEADAIRKLLGTYVSDSGEVSN